MRMDHYTADRYRNWIRETALSDSMSSDDGGDW